MCGGSFVKQPHLTRLHPAPTGMADKERMRWEAIEKSDLDSLQSLFSDEVFSNEASKLILHAVKCKAAHILRYLLGKPQMLQYVNEKGIT